MVELTFASRAQHFVPLALLRYIADNSTLPSEIEYIGDAGAKAIKGISSSDTIDVSLTQI